MTSTQDQLRALLQPLSEAEVRTLCLNAVRDWRKESNDSRLRVFSDFAPRMVAALAKRNSLHLDNRLDQVFHGCLTYIWMAPVLEFLWWMVDAGLLIPLGAPQPVHLSDVFLVTRAGDRFLRADVNHPLLPGFIERIRARCSQISENVLTLISDAHTCYQRSLLRPAVVLLGVAWESAIEDIADALEKNQYLSPPIPSRAAQRLSSVRGAIPQRFPGKDPPSKEARAAAERACNFADDLRCRRNDGSHTTPRYPFDDREEVEELFILSAMNLPHLWAMG